MKTLYTVFIDPNNGALKVWAYGNVADGTTSILFGALYKGGTGIREQRKGRGYGDGLAPDKVREGYMMLETGVSKEAFDQLTKACRNGSWPSDIEGAKLVVQLDKLLPYGLEGKGVSKAWQMVGGTPPAKQSAAPPPPEKKPVPVPPPPGQRHKRSYAPTLKLRDADRQKLTEQHAGDTSWTW